MDKYKKKRIIRAAAVLTFAALLLMPCLPIHGEAEIYRKVLRLHVIADSDSPDDQSIKLSVRDAVLDVIPDILGECRTYDEAKTALADENNQAVLLAAARERLKELGAGCDAAITLGEEYYPTREVHLAPHRARLRLGQKLVVRALSVALPVGGAPQCGARRQ